MVHVPPLQYACIHCGRSCELFDVEVERDSPLTGTLTRPDGSRHLRCFPDGCCHLVESKTGRCGVYSQRPQPCRDFPFRVTETPGGLYVGASFACTAVANSLGPKIADEAWDWSQWQCHRPRTEMVVGQPASWTDYLRIEEFLSDQFCLPEGTWTGALHVTLAVRSGQTKQLGHLPLHSLGDEVESTGQRILRGLLALVESGDDVERAQVVLTSLAQGGKYWSQIFPGWVEPSQVWKHLPEDGSAHWEVVEPFFRHLLFRKFLWGPPSIHARVCLLPLLNEMLRYWSWQQALQGQAPPTREQRLEAVRELERRITFHAQGWEDYVQPLSLAFLQGVS